MCETEQQDQKQANLLYDFFTHIDDPLSDQDQVSLTPILNALKAPETRYGAPNLIAEGGEKRIYRVYDQYLNRYVALAKPVETGTNTELERFLSEGQLTANLTHPNIVPIHNMGIDSDGIPFFTMELIPGDSLGDIIDHLRKGDPNYTKRYSREALLSIFSKICDAVAYAHSRDVVHLDIKPDNIRIGQFGEVLVCDWGLALVRKHVETGEAEPGQLDSDVLNEITLTGTVKGTPGFMAPEQILNAKKNHLSDIYALGAILYFMITCQLPVDGRSAQERMDNTRAGKLIPVRRRKVSRAVPAGLAAIIMKALSFTPENRYEDVQALQRDLGRFMTGHPTQAEPFNIFNQLFMLILRNRNLTLWLLVFLMILSIVMIIDNQIIKREKQTAETNLSLFMQEQEKSQEMYDQLTRLSLASQNVRGFADAKAMIQLSEQLLVQTHDPEIRYNLLRNKGELHFVLQHFNQAVQTYAQLPALDKKSQRRMELCKKYARIKPDDDDFLSETQLARLIATPTTVSIGNAMYLYRYHTEQDAELDPAKHIKVVGAMLARLNNINPDRIPDLELSTLPEGGYHLDMSHTPYSVYNARAPSHWRVSVLECLNLSSLDISHTPISLAGELRSLRLKKLRMVGTIVAPINEFRRRLEIMEVEQVTLGQGDYPKSLIKALQDNGVEVILEEYRNPE